MEAGSFVQICIVITPSGKYKVTTFDKDTVRSSQLWNTKDDALTDIIDVMDSLKPTLSECPQS